MTRCDACGKTVKNRDEKLRLDASYIKNYNVDLCEKCAAPLVAILKKLDLLKTE